MITIKRLTVRGGSLLTAFAFVAATIVPVLVSESAYAAGQFSPRKLTMSSQASGSIAVDANGNAVAPGAGGNGAQANHAYNFTAGTTGAVQSLLLQYCTTPLLDTACTAPTGMDASTVTSIVAGQSGGGATAFTLDTSTSVTTGNYFATYPCASRAHCITLQRTGGANITASTAISLAFGTGGGTDWVKNPTASGTFFVRIYSFSNNSYGAANQIDAAAVAGSVNTTIDITAKVQEKLNFSVSGVYSAPTAACTALAGSGAIALGDPTNGVLDIATAYDAHSYFRLNTNANGGTNVFYSGDTLKNVAGTNSITALTSTAVASAVGTSQFGLALDTGNANHSFTNLAATAPYAGGSGTITNAGTALFAFNVASVTTPVQVAGVASGTVSCDTGDVRYLGNISTTTKAGIYKTSIAYIAVPTF